MVDTATRLGPDRGEVVDVLSPAQKFQIVKDSLYIRFRRLFTRGVLTSRGEARIRK